MKITCERGLIKKTGLIGFKWSANFAFRFKNPADPNLNLQFSLLIAELRKLTWVCSAFTDWLDLQADFPNEGHICSITITSVHKDENGNYLMGKILTDLKVSYRETHL